MDQRACLLVDVPVGAVLPYAGPINNERIRHHLETMGWLVCDGSTVHIARYPELFAVIGLSYGYPAPAPPPPPSPPPGLFSLPDYRGIFLRGVDEGTGQDPDASSRSAANPENMTGNAGDNVGSRQGEAIQRHEHFYTQPGTVSVVTEGTEAASPVVPSETPNTPTSGITHALQDTEDPVTTETRPKNVSIWFIIKCRSRLDPPATAFGCSGDKDVFSSSLP